MDNVRWYKEEKTTFKCSPNIKQKVSWGWSTSLVADCLLDQKSLLGQLFKDNALKLPYSTNSYIDIYDSVTRWVPVFVVDEVTRSWLDISDFVCRNLQRWRRWTSTRKTISQVTINYQFSSVTQSCPTLCDPLDCSTSGLPVHHQLPEFTQTHVHWVRDAIQPSHPLSSLSPPSFSLSHRQGLFKWVSFSHQVAKVLEFQLQHQSFQWLFRTDFLWDGLIGSPCRPRDSQESSPTPQFKSINSSVLSSLYSPTLTSILEKP